MSASVLQERSTSASAAAGSILLAFNSNLTAGSGLHVIATQGGGSGVTYTFTDNNSGSYAASASAFDTTDNQGLGHSTAQNHAAGATTVTCTFSASSGFPGIWIREIGSVTTTPVDGKNISAPAVATTASIAATNATQPALISALGLIPAQVTPTATAPLVSDVSGINWGAGSNAGISAHLRVTTTASQSAAFAVSPQNAWLACIAIFDEAAGVSLLPQNVGILT